MTTIITRLYPDTKSAGAVLTALQEKGMPDNIIDVIQPGDDAHAEMAAARVSADSAAAYGEHLTGNRRLVVVRAPFNPIGAARAAIGIVDSESSLDVGLAKEDQYISEEVNNDLFVGQSILKGHPLMFSQDLAKPGWSAKRGLMAANFGMRALSKPKARRSASSRGGNNFPLGKKIIRSNKHSVIEGGGHPFSNALGLPMLSFKNS